MDAFDRPAPNLSIVYSLTETAMPNLVKIGRIPQEDAQTRFVLFEQPLKLGKEPRHRIGVKRDAVGSRTTLAPRPPASRAPAGRPGGRAGSGGSVPPLPMARGLRAKHRRAGPPQYSPANMTVSTRAVMLGSDGSREARARERSK